MRSKFQNFLQRGKGYKKSIMAIGRKILTYVYYVLEGLQDLCFSLHLILYRPYFTQKYTKWMCPRHVHAFRYALTTSTPCPLFMGRLCSGGSALGSVMGSVLGVTPAFAADS